MLSVYQSLRICQHLFSKFLEKYFLRDRSGSPAPFLLFRCLVVVFLFAVELNIRLDTFSGGLREGRS